MVQCLAAATDVYTKVSPQEVRKRSYLFSVRRHLDVGIFLGLFYFFLQASKVSEHHHARSQQQVAYQQNIITEK